MHINTFWLFSCVPLQSRYSSFDGKRKAPVIELEISVLEARVRRKN